MFLIELKKSSKKNKGRIIIYNNNNINKTSMPNKISIQIKIMEISNRINKDKISTNNNNNNLKCIRTNRNRFTKNKIHNLSYKILSKQEIIMNNNRNIKLIAMNSSNIVKAIIKLNILSHLSLKYLNFNLRIICRNTLLIKIRNRKFMIQ